MLGGATGAVVVSALDQDAPAPPPPPAGTSTPDASERLRAAVARASEGIVTVFVDLPARAGSDTITSNFGTGIVLDDGFVLTAAHVVAGAARIAIVLPGGEEREATLVADDAPFQDVAMLRTDGRGLRSSTLGDSSTARVGDPIVVIASGLFTYENQVKQGIVSARDQDFPHAGVTYRGMFQTDTAVNHGDSGGALVDASGQVIGMATAIVRENPGGDAVEGVAFAHAINDLKPFIDAVVATGANPRPRLGIERVGSQHVPLDATAAQQLGVPVTAGAAIIYVAPGSPADDAGIAAGDIVLAVQGIAIDAELPFVNLLGAAPTGVDLQLTVLRDGETRDVLVRPRPVAGGLS